jgi:hypothetical protein
MGTMLNGGHSILLVIANGKSEDLFLQTAFVIVGMTKKCSWSYKICESMYRKQARSSNNVIADSSGSKATVTKDLRALYV